jgi:hypothetical protein
VSRAVSSLQQTGSDTACFVLPPPAGMAMQDLPIWDKAVKNWRVY